MRSAASPRPSRGDDVKVLALILAVLIGTVLLVGALFLIIVQSPRHFEAAQLLATLALTVQIYGPLFLGSVRAQWDVRGSEGGRAYFRRAIWIVLGLEVLAAVAIVAFAILVGAPVWLPVVFIGGGAALTVIALVLGRFIRRYDEARPRPERPWEPISRQGIRKKIAIIAVTFVAVFVVGLVVFGILLNAESQRSSSTATQISFAFQFALLGGAMANMIVAAPLDRQVRAAVGPDLGTVRKVAKVVLSKKNLELDSSERVAAARYATMIPTLLGFMLGYVTLLYVAIGVQQVRLISDPHFAFFAIGFTVLMVAFLLFAYPYYVVRIRRARRYARDHQALLESDDEPVGS